MYTQHQEGIDDIFVCDICEAIFLREPSIVEHLQAQHKEELLALDAGQLRSVIVTDNNKRDREEETDSPQIDAKRPCIDSSFLERQFYVCDTCDDIFLDRKRLESHTKIEHESTDTTLQSKRILTPTKPQTKSQVCRVSSPQRQNTGSIFSPIRNSNLLGIRPSTSNKTQIDNVSTNILGDKCRNIDIVSNINSVSSCKENIASNANEKSNKKERNNDNTKTIKNGMKDSKEKDETEKSKVKSKPSEIKSKKCIVMKFNPEEHYSPTSKTPSTSNSSPPKEFPCHRCSTISNNYSNAKNHFLSHHYDLFKNIAPFSAPFSCPECNKEHRDKITFWRHYAFAHKKLFELSGISEEAMEKEIRGTNLKV